MSELDKLDQLRTQMEKHKADYASLARAIGTEKDCEQHRKKVARARDRFSAADNKASAMLASPERQRASANDAGDWSQLEQQIRQLRMDYEVVDRDARARENTHRLGGGGPSGGANGGGGGGDHQHHGGGGQGGHQAVKMEQFRQVDDAELLTEEAIQTEKLQGILEVERDMNELQGMYHELHGHVEQQQGGLNTAEANIDRSQQHVEKGVVELKQANKLQKSSRKKMFILLGIIAVIIIIVIVVVVMTKG